MKKFRIVGFITYWIKSSLVHVSALSRIQFNVSVCYDQIFIIRQVLYNISVEVLNK